jgi:hypothetical protein
MSLPSESSTGGADFYRHSLVDNFAPACCDAAFELSDKFTGQFCTGNGKS